MQRTLDLVTAELSREISALGTDGGLVGPSIYDTAQVIRLDPRPESKSLALEWLKRQQQTDGGFGRAGHRRRDVPTLAAVLALHTHDQRSTNWQAVRAGLEFLRSRASDWVGPLGDDIPVGVELTLPRLLDDARLAGLDIPLRPYASLIELGARRCSVLQKVRPVAGGTLSHVWEAWGVGPDPQLQDASGGIGHSPAATAAWLRGAEQRSELRDACKNANAYLRQAAQATGLGIAGVVPTVWPITRFEQAFSLYFLRSAGLFDSLRAVIEPQLQSLAQALKPTGLGMSDSFSADGDDTAAAIVVLRAAGRSIDPDVLQSFAAGDHFCSYPGELQASASVTAHAVHALSLFGRNCEAQANWLIERQASDGRWPADKWNTSWLYVTSHVVLALSEANLAGDSARAGVHAVLRAQNADGGWGTSHASNAEETAYCVLMLCALSRKGALPPAGREAIASAKRFLLQTYRSASLNTESLWLGKETYRPRRLARIIELTAMLAN